MKGGSLGSGICGHGKPVMTLFKARKLSPLKYCGVPTSPLRVGEIADLENE